MPILSCSAARPKEVSITTTVAKTILQPIIGFSVLVYRWGIKKLENSGLFHSGAHAARRMSDRLPRVGTESQAKCRRRGSSTCGRVPDCLRQREQIVKGALPFGKTAIDRGPAQLASAPVHRPAPALPPAPSSPDSSWITRRCCRPRPSTSRTHLRLGRLHQNSRGHSNTTTAPASTPTPINAASTYSDRIATATRSSGRR